MFQWKAKYLGSFDSLTSPVWFWSSGTHNRQSKPPQTALRHGAITKYLEWNTLMDVVYEEIYHHAEQKPVAEIIQRSQLTWLGHARHYIIRQMEKRSHCISWISALASNRKRWSIIIKICNRALFKHSNKKKQRICALDASKPFAFQIKQMSNTLVLFFFRVFFKLFRYSYVTNLPNTKCFPWWYIKH